MLLEDRILINAPASRVFAFFDNMERNYTDWHPDHVCFEWRKGHGVAVGNTFYFEEKIGGQHMKKQVVFTTVERDRRMDFAPVNRLIRLIMPRLTFETRPVPEGTEFVAQIVLRVGHLAQWLNRKEFDAVRQHMAEEGRTLKHIMEEEQRTDVSRQD